MSKVIVNIMNDMTDVLDAAQLLRLQEVLVWRLDESEKRKYDYSNDEYLEMFLTAKKLEGCSDRTIQSYSYTLSKVLQTINKPIIKISTEDLRSYLVEYQVQSSCSKVYIDIIRRICSSFFGWLEDEDHILKSPVNRIRKIKTTQKVKETISDEGIEKIRDGCSELRDLAMIDFLLSTGIRVGELVALNISDVNFEARECVVHGKGDKDRKAYFDARSKIHLEMYLEKRKDDNPALFVGLRSPYNRLSVSGVETRIHNIGERNKVNHLHPHKFRRTMATKAIDKGMPIEQVQRLLGHRQIDTTLQYALVNQENVKLAHRKLLG